MKLVVSGPVPTPAAAQGMLASIWATGQAYSSLISLWMLGWGDGELHLGVSSPNPLAESNAIQGIFNAVGPGPREVVSAEPVLASARAASDWFCVRMTPAAAHVTILASTWWNQKDDTLYSVHNCVAAIPVGHVGGVVVAFHTGLGQTVGFASMSVFMTGPQASLAGQGLLAAYGPIGHHSRWPVFNQRRAVMRTLDLAYCGSLSQPRFRLDENDLGVYWHPPLTLDPRRTPPTSALIL
ncbi:MAG: hypothetical protein ACYCZN_02070 [Candidatus Dormibacteria bacterium]